jgi:hypothetical protein
MFGVNFSPLSELHFVIELRFIFKCIRHEVKAVCFIRDTMNDGRVFRIRPLLVNMAFDLVVGVICIGEWGRLGRAIATLQYTEIGSQNSLCERGFGGWCLGSFC